MKTKLLITCALIFTGMFVYSQDILVGWTFPTASMADSFANIGLAVNKTKVIQLKSDSTIKFIAITSTNKYAQARGLTNGTATQKGWYISFNAQGYKDLKLNSTQWACPMHSGPKKWKAQFKISAMGMWTEIPLNKGVVECGLDSNYTKGSLKNVAIPPPCNDNPLIFIRWIMTSDSNVAGASMGTDIVTGGSMSRIDNISITGTKILTEGDTLVGWTFSNTKMSDTIADIGILINRNRVIHLKADSMIMMINKTSFTGPSCAQAMGMSNATAEEKGWYIDFDATHYRDLKLFSRQNACMTHSGPKSWKIQYKVGAGSWTNVPNGEIVCALNWVKAAVIALPLPADCNGASHIELRWITTSDTNVAGATSGTLLVTDSSMTRIDDIRIIGNFYNDISENISDQIFEVYPNPSIGLINILTDTKSKNITIYNCVGQQIFSDNISGKVTIDLNKFGKGLFIVKLQNNSYTLTERLIIH